MMFDMYFLHGLNDVFKMHKNGVILIVLYKMNRVSEAVLILQCIN